MPLQAEEALGPISIPRGSRGVGQVFSFDLCQTGIKFLTIVRQVLKFLTFVRQVFSFDLCQTGIKLVTSVRQVLNWLPLSDRYLVLTFVRQILSF
jgi:hypothetical protein